MMQDHLLKESFPKLSSIACCKEAWVANNMHFSNGDIQWHVSFIRYVQNWEVDLEIVFFNLLYSLRWRQGGDDRFWWIPSKRKLKVRLFFLRVI
jgi:hypothetical protein